MKAQQATQSSPCPKCMHHSRRCMSGSHGGSGQCCGFAHIKRRKIGNRRAEMSALANHAFVKMNGLGNEIVVVDLRAPPGPPPPGAPPPGAPTAAAAPGPAPPRRPPPPPLADFPPPAPLPAP